MRKMSFSLTTEQVRARVKTVTRRRGWWNLQPGTTLEACEKCMGLKKGQQVQRIHTIRVVTARAEQVNTLLGYPPEVARQELIREGFPDMTPAEFVEFFCRSHRCTEWEPCMRIAFEYLD